MRALVWIIRFLLFVLLFGFAVKNDHVVELRFFFGKSWSFQLVFIILVAFAVGALMGVTATITSLLRQRHEISRLRKQLARAEHAAEQASDDAARLTGPF
ncbi:MAG: LapA family protein [Betaproteobacteria bacterium]|nr:LapA family protein [Betaproteobacteria bacterium]